MQPKKLTIPMLAVGTVAITSAAFLFFQQQPQEQAQLSPQAKQHIEISPTVNHNLPEKVLAGGTKLIVPKSTPEKSEAITSDILEEEILDDEQLDKLLSKHVPILKEETDMLNMDAEFYAEEFLISNEEALMRLDVQDKLGAIEQLIFESNPSTFGSLYIEHEPEYRIVVMSTLKDPSVMQGYFDALGHDVPITFKTVEKPLSELEASQLALASQLDNANIKADMDINIYNNTLEIYTSDTEQFKQQADAFGITLPEDIVYQELEELPTPTALYGGYKLAVRGDYCTSGYPVYSRWARKYGVSTAGHCANDSVQASSSFSNRHDVYASYVIDSGSYDLQFMRADSNSVLVSPYTFTGSSNRIIRYMRYRNSQSIGTWVSKWGHTTGAKRGQIQSRWYRSSNGGYYVRTNIPAWKGDSGGPVYIGSTAYGHISKAVRSSGPTSITLHMPMDYFPNRGLSLSTYWRRN